MDLLWELLGFAGKGFITFVTIVATVGAIFAITRRRRFGQSGARLDVKPLHKRFEALGDALREGTTEGKALKTLRKDKKASDKAKEKAPPQQKNAVYVLDFEGDLLASSVTSLRDEVNAIIAVAKPGDEVVVRLESPGGGVPHYGLAAAQLGRLKDRKLKLTVCVDRVAASGGYMMACVAERIVAAPFSIVGSIGVVAQVPNVHRLLKKYDVDYQEMTAGEFKRTVSVFGEITEKGRAKFTEQLEETHGLFKAFVKSQRPSLDIDQVATGEYWLGTKALQLGLVDQLGTSDDCLLARAAEANVYQVKFEPDTGWRRRLGRFGADLMEALTLKVLARLKSLELT
ncbi:MAG: protease SohB [Myxococcaceae bacterium]